MKLFFGLALVSLFCLTDAAAEWKKVAEASGCDERFHVLAQDGEKYVVLVRGAQQTKLFSTDGSLFRENALAPTEFKAQGDTPYTFIRPSYVEANPPKMVLGDGREKKRCQMVLSR